jgi:diguanylate cyclase (GGDEF)-like protein
MGADGRCAVRTLHDKSHGHFASRYASSIWLTYTARQGIGIMPGSDPSSLFITSAITALLLWTAFLDNDARLRTIVTSAFGMGIFFACAMTILKTRQKSFVDLFTAGAFASAALLLLMRCVIALYWQDAHGQAIDTTAFQPMYVEMFSVAMISMNIGFMLMVSRRFQLHLERMASRDGLTGTYTRSAYFDLAGKEIARTRRSGEPLSLLMLDLDNFKKINDRHGHPVGDRVLVDFVQKVNRVLRTQDIFGRYGGEEFSILLPNTPPVDAYRVARRICRLLEGATMTDMPSYTVSIGTATMLQHEGLDLDAFVRRADQALYQAKNLGKNRVEMHAGQTLNFV